jgi:hypothetical protein
MIGPQAACIVAEIAERLAELEELKLCSAHDLCRRLATVGDRTPRLFRPVLSALRGDTLAVVESYAVQADRRGLTKQAVHFEWHADLARLREILPELAQTLQDYRDRADMQDGAGALTATRELRGEEETHPPADQGIFFTNR